MALVATLLPTVEVNDTEWDAYRDTFVQAAESNDSSPMGALKAKLHRQSLDPNLIDVLAEANRERRFLVHSYFREPSRLKSMKTAPGRLQLKQELAEIRRKFARAERVLRPELASLVRSVGLNGDVMRTEALALAARGLPTSIQEKAARRIAVLGIDDVADMVDRLLKEHPVE
jgi:hypothetical protein